MNPLDQLQRTVFEAYTYAYPHKTAYRKFETPIPLRDVWKDERRDSLFLYFHIPFCEMRCGFCNLFTSTNPQIGLVPEYLSALKRQCLKAKDALADASFARIAFGGGTPTFLEVSELESLLQFVDILIKKSPGLIPFSVEASPATVTREKLQLLRDHGVDRVSLGVQTFLESEAAAVGRRQCNATVERSLNLIREAGYPRLNIDLIYGLPGLTLLSWLRSLECALEYKPEELFLYPLYVRPLTGLGRKQQKWDDLRMECYRAARDLLLSRGYTQTTMRMFQIDRSQPQSTPAYCAQEDGMVGVGCGARSYTRSVQYSTRWAVSPPAVRQIIQEYISTSDEAFGVADYGFLLDRPEQQRRYIAQTLLNQSGLPAEGYRARFGSNVFEDVPQLQALQDLGWAFHEGGHFRLTAAGLEHSDAIGPWLYSPQVRELMSSFELL
jgi:oxygen-independent coproporphyrinogen-3 oxidase